MNEPINPSAPTGEALTPELPCDLLPKCDGVTIASTESRADVDPRKLEFVAAYHAINAAYKALVDFRGRPGAAEGRPEDERSYLQAIERTLLDCERLADSSLPFGMIACPEMEDGFTVNVTFQMPQVPAGASRRSASSCRKRFRVGVTPPRNGGPAVVWEITD